MADEKELIRKRGSFKSQLTTFATYLDTLKESSLTAAEANQLQLRMGKVETLYEQYDDVQIQLECRSENYNTHMADRVEFDSKYFTALARAKELYDDFNKKREDFESCSNRGSRTSNNHNLVKLPAITLPKFNGLHQQWLCFRDTFKSLIHSNDDIDNINKFHYLRASLEGSAALVIQSVDFSGNNYTIAWKLLCDRFDNKRLLLQNHVSALFNIEPVTKESSMHLKRVIDEVNKNLRCLESLGEPVTHWGTLLIHIISNKLDAKTYRQWEEHKGNLDKDKPISFDNFITFIRNRADLIETLELSSAPAAGQSVQPVKNVSKHRTMISTQITKHCVTSPTFKPCPKCDGDHNLSRCSQFLALSNEERLNLLPTYKVCFNCFKSGHYANHCKKQGCKVCKRKHNSLIHVAASRQNVNLNNCLPQPAEVRVPTAASQPLAAAGQVTLSTSINASPSHSHSLDEQVVLLSTALIKVYDRNNREHIVKAVLDSGSTSSIMTERICQQLNLHTECVDKSVVGINNSTSHVGKMCRVLMKSLNEVYSTRLHCFVLPSITGVIPSRQLDVSRINIPTNLCLADPNFHTPSEIDFIIGADLFWDLLGSERIYLGSGQPILSESRLGWLLAGPVNCGQVSTSSRTLHCNFTTVSSPSNEMLNDEIQNQLPRFWQLEEVCPENSHLSPEEKLCEEHFTKNTTRLEDGRFCVRLPLKENPSVLGDSINRAKHCFLSLERRIETRAKFKDMYKQFMAEYESLGHMSEYKGNQLNKNAYFIPHHGVLRESSSTTRLRVVFNASSPTSSGVSLNKIQMVGPTVQDDLLSILLRFRQHKYILSADVEKMYRQIAVHPDDRYLQQIIWRDNPAAPLKTFTLNTVTYGTASAPFLATRCLKQIGLDCDDSAVREIIIHDFYVDDLLTGGDNLEQVLLLKNKITSALTSACMPLRKWKSNEPQLMIDSDQSQLNLNIGSAEPSKTLGLSWQPDSDTLCFPVGKLAPEANTKRDLLSAVAQIFDPTGVLAPCVIRMKMLLQQLWLHKLSWDEQLSPDMCRLWGDIVRDLPCLNNIRIPRIALCDSYTEVECHIFVDASERAYGSCLYLRSVNERGDVLVRLLLAKSRVSPLKPTTIPRLELCGALVGARLYEKATKSLRLKFKSTTLWTDSTIVLGWLRMMPIKLQPFVRNRVAEILDKTGDCTWRHVPTYDNPADHISRGVSASVLQTLDLWWSGPAFLKQDKSQWPAGPAPAQSLPETRAEIALHIEAQSGQVGHDKHELVDFERFSNLSRLKRAVAYALRFINLCRKQITSTNYLSDSELKTALNFIIIKSQDQSFPEYQTLLRNQSISNKSPLIKLNVFLDDNKLLRVGGRLDNSDFPYEKKHPIIVHSNHRFTKLLFEYEHKRLMHAGPQLLLSSIKDEFWPVGGTNLAKATYRKCMKCIRMKGQIVAPLMGNLPKSRLTPGVPFESVGVDYAGPLTSASRQGRGCRLVKVYIAIFVCFTTKAVHLELVGDLTSNNYLSALRRFISRRGLPSNIYSDNGTSFVGAYNELSRFLKDNCNSLAEAAANERLNFHFVPAYSPHTGGLWEAGVKSTKFHLQRVLGDCKLTYEELNTVLVQIEAILNSRPLTPFSSEPEDLRPLTPGHFLIGRPLMSLPVQDMRSFSANHITRYQRVEQLRQHFWARWSKEYVSELQVRTKWRTHHDVLKLDTLVLVKEDNLPPLKWKLGRIVAVFPGADGVNRVADIKTATGTVRRSFSKICPLPVSAMSC